MLWVHVMHMQTKFKTYFNFSLTVSMKVSTYPFSQLWVQIHWAQVWVHINSHNFEYKSICTSLSTNPFSQLWVQIQSYKYEYKSVQTWIHVHSVCSSTYIHGMNTELLLFIVCGRSNRKVYWMFFNSQILFWSGFSWYKLLIGRCCF